MRPKELVVHCLQVRAKNVPGEPQKYGLAHVFIGIVEIEVYALSKTGNTDFT